MQLYSHTSCWDIWIQIWPVWIIKTAICIFKYFSVIIYFINIKRDRYKSMKRVNVNRMVKNARSSCSLTHLWLLDFPSHQSDVLFINRAFRKHTVETLARRRILRRLIWVCTVCLSPTKRTLGLYGFCLTCYFWTVTRKAILSHSILVTWVEDEAGKLRVLKV